MIIIKDLMSSVSLFKALGSEVRIEIIETLKRNSSMNLNELASALNLSNGAITMHIKKLEESGIVGISTAVGKHGIQKVCYLNEDKLLIELNSSEQANLYEVEIPIGHYSQYSVTPTCGLATKDSIIGEFDDPRYFAAPERFFAGVLWLSEGYVEYRIPNYLKSNQQFNEIQISLELSSEAPGFNDNYPSDIYFYLNDVELGCWTSPGDFGLERGINNPDWWPPALNQYGMIKLIRINEQGSYIDGHLISNVNLSSIKLDYKSELVLRLAVPTHAKNKRGLTIFGKHFGNYNQDICVRILYNVNNEDDMAH